MAIYAAEILEGLFTKIGFSSRGDISTRMAELQTGNPFRIRLLFLVEGTLVQERAIHASLQVAYARIGVPMPPNEWYTRCPFLQQFLSELDRSTNAALAFSERYNPAIKQPSTRFPPRENAFPKDWAGSDEERCRYAHRFSRKGKNGTVLRSINF